MAQIPTLSNDVSYILKEGSTKFATKYQHTFVGTCHIFEALVSFLVNNGGNDRYENTYEKFYGILTKYNNGQKFGRAFETEFLKLCPEGATPSDEAGIVYNIKPNKEWGLVLNELTSNAINQKRTMEIEDLIMSLFADKAYDLYKIWCKVLGSETKTDEMYDEIRKAFIRDIVVKIDELEQITELENLNEYVSTHPQTTIDYNDTIRKIEMGLVGRTVKNVVLTGPAGCGKTQYVLELAQRLNKNDVPAMLKGKVIYSLSIASLMSDTKYRGEMETKLDNIFSALSGNPNAILFIDELHMMADAGSGVDGATSAGQLIKPYLSRGDIQVIGATTSEEYTKYILPDKAFARRFSEVKISEPTIKETKEILSGLLPVESKYFNKTADDGIIDRVAVLSDRYSLEQANPAKSIMMLEDAYKYAKIYDPENKHHIDVDDLDKAVSVRYGIFISKDRLADTDKELHRVLLGQDRAIKEVVDALKVVDRGIVDKDRPMMSMLLTGSTGVGKTETAKIIAKTFFGSDKNLVKINMGEYSSEEDMSKLLGSAPGLVGYDDEPALIKGVREHPSSVVLFDEIEKAHPTIQKAILNVLDEGTLQDNKGNKVSFKNNIIIFTTNLGYDSSIGQEQGIGFTRRVVTASKTKTMDAIRNYFRPEFLGRLDKIIFYDSLPESIIRQLIDRYFKEYKEQCPDITISKFTEADIKEIIKNSNIGANGARGVRKQVRHQIVEAENRDEEKECVVA